MLEVSSRLAAMCWTSCVHPTLRHRAHTVTPEFDSSAGPLPLRKQSHNKVILAVGEWRHVVEEA